MTTMEQNYLDSMDVTLKQLILFLFLLLQEHDHTTPFSCERIHLFCSFKIDKVTSPALPCGGLWEKTFIFFSRPSVRQYTASFRACTHNMKLQSP